MDRRRALQQLITIPAAAGVAACVRGTSSEPRRPKIDDVTGRRGAPFEALTSYTTKEAADFAKLPAAPTLLDFLEHRFVLAQHLLYAGRWAMQQKLPEPVIMACLLHDDGLSISRPDHGYWAEQLLGPYVSDETLYAVRTHQALRFFADPANGYKGPPGFYADWFGKDYKLDPYLVAEYNESRNHKWYLSARLVTMSDQETPEPSVIYFEDKPSDVLDADMFTDIIGRNFKQPKEGLGFDGSPVAHMWRTLINPTRPL